MKKLYDIYSGEELKIAEKIQQRRRQMIVHSCLYYVMDESIVSDHQWAAWGKELMELQDRYPDISKNVPFAKHFKNWDASSGYHLPINEPWAIDICERLLRRRNVK